MTDTNNQDKNKTGIQTPAKDNQNPVQVASDKKEQDQNRTKTDSKVDEKKDDSGKDIA